MDTIEQAIAESICVVCAMRVQVNTIGGSLFWGHSRYPMNHPATPNDKAIKWHERGVI